MQYAHRAAGTALRQRQRELSSAIVERQYSLQPELAERYGARGYEKCRKDAGYHLGFLAEAVSAGSAALFVDYVAWAKVMLAARGVPPDDLALNLACMQAVLQERLPEETATVAARYVEQGLRKLPDLPSEVPAPAEEDEPHGPLAQQYLEALLKAKRHEARQLILDAVARGAPVRDLYLHVFQRAQYEVGRRWQMNQISVAQEHFCTAATQQIMTELYPHIFGTERKGRVLVMACVSDELHEIGARMVADFFEMDGWDTFYLGANTPTAGIVETVAKRQADVLGISATMAYHVDRVRGVIDAVRKNEAAAHVKILVGGYPFDVDAELARRIGADGGAPSADEAIALANLLVDRREA